MLFLKLIQQLVKALNSEGTPGQVAAGIALGAVFGLTPLMNLHNLVLFGLALILNVSMAGVFLGWTVFVPVGFALDPLFDAIGRALLGAGGLRGLWTTLYNAPIAPLTRFNNTVVMGSFVFALVAFVPIYISMRKFVIAYRTHIGSRLERWKVYQVINRSTLVQWYKHIRDLKG